MQARALSLDCRGPLLSAGRKGDVLKVTLNGLAISVLSGLVLSGCASGGANVASPTTTASMRTTAGLVRPATGSIMYAASATIDSVDIYSISGLTLTQTGSITDGIHGPRDVFVTTNHTLYVLNNATITEYPNGQSSPTERIITPVVGGDMTVGPDGTIFVCGRIKGTGRNAVAEFDPGAVQPSRLIKYRTTIPYPIGCSGMATDSKGNLYVNVGSEGDGGGYSIEVYPPKHVKPDRYLYSGNNYTNGGMEIIGTRLIDSDYQDGVTFITDLSGRKHHTIPDPSSAGGGLVIDPTTDYLYLDGGDENSLAIYDLPSGKLLATFPTFNYGGIAIDPPAY